MRLLRLWLAATAVVLAGMAVWALAPVLLFVALLTLALGILAAIVIWQARLLRTWLDRR